MYNQIHLVLMLRCVNLYLRTLWHYTNAVIIIIIIMNINLYNTLLRSSVGADYLN